MSSKMLVYLDQCPWRYNSEDSRLRIACLCVFLHILLAFVLCTTCTGWSDFHLSDLQSNHNLAGAV